jgi:hypothetical protein
VSDPVVVETPHGPAEVVLDGPDTAGGLLVLGHGAGGGVEAPDLRTATRAAVDLGLAVARVLQPYRVAGRRAPAPAAQLDAAWAAVVADLRERFPYAAQVHGGRSSGARVACRGAAVLHPVGVLALAFPTRPPVKPGKPQQDRTPELDAVPVPVLAIAGGTDRFGRPADAPGRTIVDVRGDHALRGDLRAVAAAVRDWLPTVVHIDATPHEAHPT